MDDYIKKIFEETLAHPENPSAKMSVGYMNMFVAEGYHLKIADKNTAARLMLKFFDTESVEFCKFIATHAYKELEIFLSAKYSYLKESYTNTFNIVAYSTNKLQYFVLHRTPDDGLKFLFSEYQHLLEYPMRLHRGAYSSEISFFELLFEQPEVLKYLDLSKLSKEHIEMSAAILLNQQMWDTMEQFDYSTLLSLEERLRVVIEKGLTPLQLLKPRLSALVEKKRIESSVAVGRAIPVSKI